MSLFTKILFTLAAPILVPLTHGMTYQKWFKQVWGDEGKVKPEEDTRTPSNFAAKVLAEWDTMGPCKDSPCMRLRTEAILHYPQADPAAFAEARRKCEEYFVERDRDRKGT